jgi:hypothetical protein
MTLQEACQAGDGSAYQEWQEAGISQRFFEVHFVQGSSEKTRKRLKTKAPAPGQVGYQVIVIIGHDMPVVTTVTTLEAASSLMAPYQPNPELWEPTPLEELDD